MVKEYISLLNFFFLTLERGGGGGGQNLGMRQASPEISYRFTDAV